LHEPPFCLRKTKNAHAIGNIAGNVDVDVRRTGLLRPIHMESFLQALCQQYGSRFAGAGGYPANGEWGKTSANGQTGKYDAV